MRTLLAAIATVLLASCAATSPRDTTAVVDHKTNQIRQAAAQPQSEFVGTSAKVDLATRKPSWYAFGHPLVGRVA